MHLHLQRVHKHPLPQPSVQKATTTHTHHLAHHQPHHNQHQHQHAQTCPPPHHPPDYTPTPTREQIATAEKELTRIKTELDHSADPDALAERERESIDHWLSVLIEKSKEPYSTRKWMCRTIKKRLERLQARIQRARDLGRQDGIEVAEAIVLAGIPGFAYPGLRRR